MRRGPRHPARGTARPQAVTLIAVGPTAAGGPRALSGTGIWLGRQEVPERAKPRQLAFREIAAGLLKRANRTNRKIPFAAVMADGSAHTQGGHIIAAADEFLDLPILEIIRAAARASGKASAHVLGLRRLRSADQRVGSARYTVTGIACPEPSSNTQTA